MAVFKVLVVDDSAFMRHILVDFLQSDRDLKVIDTAYNGLTALSKIKELKPDVVTLDVEMPGLNGLEVLDKIMRDCPVPVVMVSSVTVRGARQSLQALELGAVDFVTKPGQTIGCDLSDFKRELVTKVKAAAGMNRNVLKKKTQTGSQSSYIMPERFSLVVIGSSTGGPSALTTILPCLKSNFPVGIVVVQHMPKGFTRPLAERLNQICALKVQEASAGDVVKKGTVLIAPAGNYVTLKKEGEHGVIALHNQPIASNLYRPSADDLFLSAADVYGPFVLAVILTGMGRDGTRGLAAVRKKGGKVIAQSEDTCVIYGMPRSAVEAGVVDTVIPLGEIGYVLNKLVQEV